MVKSSPLDTYEQLKSTSDELYSEDPVVFLPSQHIQILFLIIKVLNIHTN